MSTQDSDDAPASVPDGDSRAHEIREALTRKLVELSEGKLASDEIDPRANLLDYGYVDSLSAVMFLAFIEERYGVRIDDLEVAQKYYSLDAIVQHLLENN